MTILKQIASSLLLVLLLAGAGFSATENLDEVIARQSRISTAAWADDYLEDSTDYTWQPETLLYEDVTYGHEVCLLNAQNGRETSLPDIAWPQWSADGKRIAYVTGRHTQAWTDRDSDITNCIWMTQRTDGSYLRVMPGSPNRSEVSAAYFHWSPVLPDTYYATVSQDYFSRGLDTDDLFKCTATDTSDSYSVLINAVGHNFNIKKSISSDGTKIIGGSTYRSRWHPFTVYPDADAAKDVDGGYVSNRPTYDNYWGDTQNRETATDTNNYHDQYLTGTGSDVWFYIMPEADPALGSCATWWRAKPTGSASDGGTYMTEDHASPYDWWDNPDSLQNVNTPGSGAGEENGYDPWCDDDDETTQCSVYWSHPCPCRWGNKVAFSYYMGPGVYNLDDLSYDVSEIGSGDIGSQHTDWHAWSDYFAFSSGDVSTDYPLQTILISKYDDGTTSEYLCKAHIAASGAYNRLARPSQSPDGTKVTWHSTFLNNNDDDPYLFYVVAYYPYPPEITACSASGGTVTVSCNWQTAGTTRGYTTRGWPDESTDDPPPPRETEKFRLWRSADGTSWTPVDTVSAGIFDRYDFSAGTWETDYSAASTWDLTDAPGDGTWYYAVTAQEWSGLESHDVSNVFSIAVSSGSGTGSQSAAYPTDPGADADFFTASPDAPQSLAVTHKQSPADQDGQYTVEWSAPANDSYVRHYNIYAEDGSTPVVSQTNRIASVPVSTDYDTDDAYSYIDVFGATDGTTQYGVTSVDYQGNEASITTTDATDTTPPALSGSLSIEIPTGGDSVIFHFSENVTFSAGGNEGFTASMSGGAVTLSSATGSGTSDIMLTTSRTIQSGETGTASYDSAVGNVADTSSNALTNFATETVSNGSVQGAASAVGTITTGSGMLMPGGISSIRGFIIQVEEP